MNGRTIAKNASVMMISQLVTWGLTIVLTIFLPRYLGAAALGQFHLANSLWAILAIAVTFGMEILLTKEIARDKKVRRAARGSNRRADRNSARSCRAARGPPR